MSTSEWLAKIKGNLGPCGCPCCHDASRLLLAVEAVLRVCDELYMTKLEAKGEGEWAMAQRDAALAIRSAIEAAGGESR